MLSPYHLAVLLIAALLLTEATASEPEPQVDAAKSRLWTGSDVPCDEAIERSSSLNAPQFFSAYVKCWHSGRIEDAVFLLLLGQIRTLSDMETLEPQTELDEDAITKLYGAFYYTYGGTGPEALYRDQGRVEAMLHRLHNWKPSWSESYDPGWDYKTPVDLDHYYLRLAYELVSRITKLQWYSRLVQDERRQSAIIEQEEIRLRNESEIEPGSADAERLKELAQIISKVGRSIPYRELQLPPELEPNYEPPEDADFELLHAGFNAPDPNPDSFKFYMSRSEAEESWLSQTLSAARFEQILDQVDFQQQALFVLGLPVKDSATGTLYIRDIRFRDAGDSVSVSVSTVIGVNQSDCPEPKARSRPFVVAATPKPALEIGSRGSSTVSLVEGCQPPIGTGTPSAE